ncbi:MAG: RHS repeat-associated core domain-containing protein [Treponema sp.]|nr:RHS repeat-associated core domain-containing protein [Treponema sp.]
MKYNEKTGGEALYFNAMWDLSQVVTNWEGKIYERYEYTPCGEAWIEWENREVPRNEKLPYRFTGKEPDGETGLYYYGARYLDPRAARRLSADPAAGEYVPAAAADRRGGVSNAVNLHLYHYAGNNPVKYTDLDGKETVIFSIPVIGKHRHLFIAVKTEDGTITTKSIYPADQITAARDVFTGGTQENLFQENRLEEHTIAEKYFNGESLPTTAKKEAEIKAPDGMTQEEFDNIVLENAWNYPAHDRPYNATRGPNSNTYVDDVIESSGGKMPDIPNATQQNWGE